ncbi:unnamed protein product [Blepharisma stoltei]|uniref:HNH homing endonuclease n=1 Tax=Blepharisma stoltei TaxID=1481888 RepID=A0AAU9K6K3_9CILI|nr:unnamed protein product [Blepharisma stoltei]
MDEIFVPYSKPKKNAKDVKHWAGKSKNNMRRPLSGINSDKRTKKSTERSCEAWGDGREDYYNWWDTVPKAENEYICNRRKAQLKGRNKIINYTNRKFSSENPCKKLIRHLNWKYWQILDRYDSGDCEIKWLTFEDGFEDSIFHVVEDRFIRKSIRALVNRQKARKIQENIKI